MIPYAERPGAEQDRAMTAELRGLGFELESVYELRNRYDSCREAVPVLASWLPRVSAFGLKESMLRSLAVRYAKKEALDAVIRDFAEMDTREDPTGYQLRWAAGNALEVLWDDARFDDLRALCVDPAFGRGREMVVRGLGRSKRPEAVSTLLGLLADDDVRVPAVLALRKLKPSADTGARDALVAARSGQEAWVVKEIDKTLAKLPG